MSAPRYLPEFKQEAIKQVTERGHKRVCQIACNTSQIRGGNSVQ